MKSKFTISALWCQAISVESFGKNSSCRPESSAYGAWDGFHESESSKVGGNDINNLRISRSYWAGIARPISNPVCRLDMVVRPKIHVSMI